MVDRYYNDEPTRSWRRDNEYWVVKFMVYRLDEEWRRWVHVKDLEERVFMLGDSASFSVCANDFEGCEGNCIFFTDILGVRVYNFG